MYVYFTCFFVLGNVYLSWIDEDNDVIKIVSDDELMDSLKYQFKNQATCVLKFNVNKPAGTKEKASIGCKIADESMNIDAVVHVGVTCDECGVSPIKGNRFKCTVRDNFDLCETCEKSKVQPFAMVSNLRFALQSI